MPPNSNFILKRGGNTRGGLGQNPRRKYSGKTEKNNKRKIKTTAYGNLNRGNPQRFK